MIRRTLLAVLSAWAGMLLATAFVFRTAMRMLEDADV